MLNHTKFDQNAAGSRLKLKQFQVKHFLSALPLKNTCCFVPVRVTVTKSTIYNLLLATSKTKSFQGTCWHSTSRLNLIKFWLLSKNLLKLLHLSKMHLFQCLKVTGMNTGKIGVEKNNQNIRSQNSNWREVRHEWLRHVPKFPPFWEPRPGSILTELTLLVAALRCPSYTRFSWPPNFGWRHPR